MYDTVKSYNDYIIQFPMPLIISQYVNYINKEILYTDICPSNKWRTNFKLDNRTDTRNLSQDRIDFKIDIRFRSQFA